MREKESFVNVRTKVNIRANAGNIRMKVNMRTKMIKDEWREYKDEDD